MTKLLVPGLDLFPKFSDQSDPRSLLCKQSYLLAGFSTQRYWTIQLPRCSERAFWLWGARSYAQEWIGLYDFLCPGRARDPDPSSVPGVSVRLPCHMGIGTTLNHGYGYELSPLPLD